MHLPEIFPSQKKLEFMPAVYGHTRSAGHFVEYYYYDGKLNALKRKVIRLNVQARKLSRREFRIYVVNLCSFINDRLRCFEPIASSADTPQELPPQKSKQNLSATPVLRVRKVGEIRNAFNDFIAEKEKDLRRDTMRSYSSFVTIFGGWCSKSGIVEFSEINGRTVGDFMHDAYVKRDVSAVTYNNYLKIGRALLNWCVERGYMAENPFVSITKKRTQKKRRTIIPREDRARMLDYLEGVRPNYIIICMLVYSALIRPKEIRMIQIKHIHIDDHYIEIPGENAKNHRTRYAAISPELCIRLASLRLERYPLEWYLFGSHIEPSESMASPKCYKDFWDKVRREMKFPQEYKLYSLRDTGITEMLESGIPDIKVMKHADHSSLEVTSIYASHKDKNLISDIFVGAPKF